MTVLAKLKAAWASFTLVLIIGFCLGWLALKYVGIPFLVPSHAVLSVQVAGYRDLEAEATETIDKAERLRSAENTVSIEAVDDERFSCQVRIDNLTAAYELAISQFTEEQTDEESADDNPRRLSARELFGIPQELRTSDDR